MRVFSFSRMRMHQHPHARAPELDLASIGVALYGNGWRGALAQDLGFSSETEVLQLETAHTPMPQWLREALVGIAQRRAASALDIAGRLALESGALASESARARAWDPDGGDIARVERLAR